MNTDTCRSLQAFTRYNHLKLIERIPSGSSLVVFHDTLAAEDGSSSSGEKKRENEVVLAHFTSELKSREYGMLLTYDDAIADLWQRFMQGCEGRFTGFARGYDKRS